jgi:hypothetical protein
MLRGAPDVLISGFAGSALGRYQGSGDGQGLEAAHDGGGAPLELIARHGQARLPDRTEQDRKGDAGLEAGEGGANAEVRSAPTEMGSVLMRKVAVRTGAS